MVNEAGLMDPILLRMLQSVGVVNDFRFSARATVAARPRLWIVTMHVEMDIEWWWQIDTGKVGFRVHRARFI